MIVRTEPGVTSDAQQGKAHLERQTPTDGAKRTIAVGEVAGIFPKEMIESIDLLTSLIAQFPAQELASRCLGQLLQNLNMPGILIICHALLTELDQLPGRDLSLKPAFKGNIGYDRFAPVSVWHT